MQEQLGMKRVKNREVQRKTEGDWSEELKVKHAGVNEAARREVTNEKYAYRCDGKEDNS